MKTVRAKQTLHGSYGLKKEGDEFEVQNSFAEDMAERGLVEIVGEEETEKKETNKASDEDVKEKAVITDNTKSEKKQITKPGTVKK